MLEKKNKQLSSELINKCSTVKYRKPENRQHNSIPAARSYNNKSLESSMTPTEVLSEQDQRMTDEHIKDTRLQRTPAIVILLDKINQNNLPGALFSINISDSSV